MIALDTETTGVDFHHGARPFFVTVCYEDGIQRWWEWEVDPCTRRPEVPPADVDEIKSELADVDVVGQNLKFDATALRTLGIEPWPWGRTDDTLLAGHLLASNQPHDLTSMVIQYLGRSIQPFEDALEMAVKEARRLVKLAWFVEKFGDWAIASPKRLDMPSCPKGNTNRLGRGDDRDRSWKSDMWLPRAVCLAARRVSRSKILGELVEYARPDHPWLSVLAEYSNTDSAATLALWRVMRRELDRRSLWKIYQERRKLLPVVHDMEWHGVTLSRTRLEKLSARYSAESVKAEKTCYSIAASYNHQVPCPRAGLKTHWSKLCPDCQGAGEVNFSLQLPKGATNQSLETFFFDVMGLPPVYSEKAKTDKPTMGRDAIQHYKETLPAESKEFRFVETLAAKRARDTALSYLSSYTRFWLPLAGSNGCYILYPSLNPTGSDTLRFGSQNPNEQNISTRGMDDDDTENIRQAFGPPPGYEWWSLDAKNIELRIPAYKSGESVMVDLFEEPDAPPFYGSVHLLNFSVVYPDLWNQAVKQVGDNKAGPWCKQRWESTWYRWAKIGGFSLQYGAQEKTADRAFRRCGCYRALKSNFTALEELNQECIRFANKYGYVETWPDRTVDSNRGYPLLVARTNNGSVLPTVPFNYRVQGTAMQWTCKGMVRCHEVLADWNRKATGHRIVLQVHDEMVFELPRRADPRVDPKRSNLGRARELARVMALGGDDIGVPTPVGIEYHPEHWGSGVTFKA